MAQTHKWDISITSAGICQWITDHGGPTAIPITDILSLMKCYFQETGCPSFNPTIKELIGVIYYFFDDMTNGNENTNCNFIVNDLMSFRNNCLSGGSVVCDNQELYDSWLITKRLKNIWFQLTHDERDIVAKHIIEHWLFYYSEQYGVGESDCQGNASSWKDALCWINALIRFLKFGEAAQYYNDISGCYYKDDEEIETCYYTGDFGLPVYMAAVMNKISGPGFGHAICAFQIGTDITDFNSWRFFQYDNSDIVPGNWQMPCLDENGGPIEVFLENVIPGTLTCIGTNVERFVGWDLDENCNPIPQRKAYRKAEYIDFNKCKICTK